MFLSHLFINIGSTPDRPMPGRMWLRNLYHVHQRLCMAFPSTKRRDDDPDFLRPYNPEDFGMGHVHVARKQDSGFLFRIDPHSGGRMVIIVQSALKPDWEYAFHNAGYLLAANPDVKSFNPVFAKGQHLWFRLVANPTRRLSETSPDAKKESIGKRVPVPTDKLQEWIVRRAEEAGFLIDEKSIGVRSGYSYMNKSRDDKGQRLSSVRYEGVLEVTDPTIFKETAIRGIGPGKAFGFGLLSVMPCQTSPQEGAR